MPLTARRSYRRRRKNPDEKEERPGESSAQVMAPTRMKLRVRRRDNAAAAGEEERTRESGSSRRKNSSKTTTAAAAATAAASPPASSASASRAVMAAEEASPDSKCPICLDRFNNLAYLDRCLHRFCFPCIQEWSHNKAECPLCKQPFASILHSVRAEDDFKEYTLRPAPANSSVAATVAMVAAMASAARSDHQMRLMLRRHRVADGGETTTRRRRRERGGRGGGRRGEDRAGGVWEWYLDSPPLPLPSLPPLPQRPDATEDSEDGDEPEERRLRGGAELSERGVIFEGLTGLGGAADPAAPSDRASRRLMTRLAARQRLQREGGTVRRLRERETVAFRRALYRCGVRVGGVVGNQGQQQQRDITAESFRRNPAHLNRLRPWLRRELTVLYGAHFSLVDIVQRIIMAQLSHHGLEDTHTIEEELRPFLLARTEHFLHELVSFARSPLSLDSYDLQATYDLQALDQLPAAALQLDGSSSSSDGSSVIAISEGEEGGGANDDVIQTGSCLSLSGWDDETPGPSYSTAEPSCSLSLSPAPQEPEANEEGGEKRAEEGEEECLIVGYKKPIAERTPELVQLSSDTEEEKKEEEEEPEKPLPPLPSTPPYLPTIPPSTSGVFRDEPDDGEKDVEAEPRRSRARSWSGSSRNSVCTLSPATPGDGERRRRWRDGKQQPGGEEVRERRRRKRRRRGRERKSGTLYNPNRSIYPAMMRRRRSPSPFRSSAESGSPPDSSWEYRCSQVSPLTSSVSSPSRSSSSSSSPFCSSPAPPPQTPPSLSPGGGDAHHGEKPGGKRKYKSRHLDSDVKDPTWRPSSSRERERRREKERRRRKERKSSRRSREDRSPSVEIIYEGTVTSDAAQPRATKRRRRRQRGTQPGSSPVIITLDSDSSHDDNNNNNTRISSSSSSSPLSSQQTVDFSDLPPLPLVHSAGVGGALDAEIGELPVDILDRGSDGSEGESKGPIAIDNSDVDVEDMEEGGASAANAHDDRPMGEKASPSDRHLLAAILDDLKGISAPKPNRPSDSEEQSQDVSVPLPPLKVPKETRVQEETGVQEETRDVPPLLRQASPVRSYNRNTPPPLKHKDAGSPRPSPVDPQRPSPANPHRPSAADPHRPSPADPHRPSPADPHHHPVLAGSDPVDSRLSAEPPNDKPTIPPISTLQRRLTGAVAPSLHSTPPFQTSPLRHPDFGPFHPAALHSSAVETPSPVDTLPVNSSADFRSANSWSKEAPALTDSTSRNKTAASPHPPPAGSGVFSGVNDTPPPGSRTPSAELHSGSPESTTDLQRPALDGPKPTAGSRPRPAGLNSSCFDGHLNHTAFLPSAAFAASQIPAAKPQNHVDPQIPAKLSQIPAKLSQIHADNHIASAENRQHSADT